MFCEEAILKNGMRGNNEVSLIHTPAKRIEWWVV
jgi:hypothetical protein